MNYVTEDQKYNLLVEEIFSRNYKAITTPDNLMHVREQIKPVYKDETYLTNVQNTSGITRIESAGNHDIIMDSFSGGVYHTVSDFQYNEKDMVKETLTLLPIKDMAIITHRGGYVRLQDPKDGKSIRDALISYLNAIQVRSSGYNYTPPSDTDIQILNNFLTIINKLFAWTNPNSAISVIDRLSTRQESPTVEEIFGKTNISNEIVKTETPSFNIAAFQYYDHR